MGGVTPTLAPELLVSFSDGDVTGDVEPDVVDELPFSLPSDDVTTGDSDDVTTASVGFSIQRTVMSSGRGGVPQRRGTKLVL